MRPSSSVTFEPGTERGVPWGRDLFTFVTSAAGHMMRTLQKPRKNRPSKRQVNHRRFLHNMIQRKFAEIEASNHQLSSSLFSREEHKSPPSPPSPTSPPSPPSPTSPPSTPSPPPTTCDLPSPLPVTCDLPSGTSRAADDVTFCFEETEIGAAKQNKSGDGCEINPEAGVDQSDTITSTAAGDTLEDGSYHLTLKEGDQIYEESQYASSNCPEKTDDIPHWGEFIQTGSPEVLSEDNLCNWIESVREKYDSQPSGHNSASNNPGDPARTVSPNTEASADPQLVLSPALSPLSLDSCDFGIQMLPDLAAYSPCSYSLSDPVDREDQTLEVLDLLEEEFSDGDCGVTMETQVTFSNMAGGQVEATDLPGKALIEDVTVPDQPGFFVEELMDCSSGDGSGVKQVDCDAELCGFGPGYDLGYDPGYGPGCGPGYVPGYGGFASQSSATFSSISSSGSREQVLLTLDPELAQRDLPPSGSTDCLQFTLNQLHSSSRRYHGDDPDPLVLRSTCSQQDRSSLWMEGDGHQECTPFGGVARSFPAPVQNPHLVLTLPLEGEWLFTDIMEGGALT